MSLVIQDLEKYLKETIPLLDKVSWNSFGGQQFRKIWTKLDIGKNDSIGFYRKQNQVFIRKM